MKIDGYKNLPRGGADRADRPDRSDRADRTDDARRAERAAAAGAGASGDPARADSFESDVTEFIGNSVLTAGRVLDQRLDALVSQRDELLRRADDPRSIRRAAENFVVERFGA